MNDGTTAAKDGTWTIAQILTWTQNYFRERHIATARLDAEVLLAHALGCERVRLYTHFDQPLTAPERQTFRAFVQRRVRHEPVAYIRGKREFYGRDFAVTPDVLIPRPETEHIIELALGHLKAQPQSPSALRILDVGTGSGILAITLAAELPDSHVTAIDISAAALHIARRNAATHKVDDRVSFIEGDLLAPCANLPPFDLIVSNPPYVEACAQLPADVRDHEPALALFAGNDGLAIWRRLIPAVRAHLQASGGLFLGEIGSTQAPAVQQLLATAGAWRHTAIHVDLQQLPRVAWAQT